MQNKEEKNYTIMAEGNNGGDKIEKEGWPIFGKDKFPNYETLWQKFVVSKTNRPTDIHPKNNTTDEECEIMSMHWQIFSNFNFIYKKLSNLVEDDFDHSFIKLSNTCDLTEELIFKLLVRMKLVDEAKVSVLLPTKLRRFDKKKVFAELKKRGGYSIPILNRQKVVYSILCDIDFTKYRKVSDLIRNYRNIIAHSWQSFHIDNKVPKPEYAKDYTVWVKITRIIKSKDQKAKDRIINEHYIDKQKLVASTTNELVSILNDIWGKLINLLPEAPCPSQSDIPSIFNNTFNTTTSGTLSSVSASGSCYISPEPESVQLSGSSPSMSSVLSRDEFGIWRKKKK